MALVRLFVVCSTYRCSIKHGKCGWFVTYNEMSIPIDDFLNPVKWSKQDLALYLQQSARYKQATTEKERKHIEKQCRL